MNYRILHIPTNTFLRKKVNTNWSTKYPVVSFWWKWKADRWWKKLPDEFYFLNENDKFVKVLKAEFVVVPVHTDRYIGKT